MDAAFSRHVTQCSPSHFVAKSLVQHSWRSTAGATVPKVQHSRPVQQESSAGAIDHSFSSCRPAADPNTDAQHTDTDPFIHYAGMRFSGFSASCCCSIDAGGVVIGSLTTYLPLSCKKASTVPTFPLCCGAPCSPVTATVQPRDSPPAVSSCPTAPAASIVGDDFPTRSVLLPAGAGAPLLPGAAARGCNSNVPGVPYLHTCMRNTHVQHSQTVDESIHANVHAEGRREGGRFAVHNSA